MIATIDRFGSGCVLRIGATEIEGLSNDAAQAVFEAVNSKVDSVIAEEAQELRAMIANLETSLDYADDEIVDLKEKNRKLDLETKKQNDEIEVLIGKLRRGKAEIDKLKLRIELKDKAIAELGDRLDFINDQGLDRNLND